MSNLTTESPLAQVSSNSLEILFNEDPNLWSGPDDPKVIEIVNKLREDRARWLLSEAKKKATPKASAQSSLSIEDLEI